MVDRDEPSTGDPDSHRRHDSDPRGSSRLERSIRYPDDPPDSFGRYLVGEAVGRGGAGTVYLATDVVLGREVALKVCRAAVAADPEGRQRFVNDARVASRLDHPGIVPVFDLAELPDGRPYFAMKRVVGESLAQALVAERPHDHSLDRDVLVEYLEVFRRVAETVAHAHDAGVIHGDLKPGNVMLGPEREVFVVDWGFARPDFPSSGGEAVGGTVAYLPPETILAMPAVDPRRGDVYGLGAILCEMLTGAPPIRATTRAQAREWYLDDIVVTNSPDFSAVDADLAELASRCLAFDPAARPSDARKVANSVRDLLDARRRAWRNAEVHAAAAIERSRAARRRTTLWVALAASLGVTLAVLGSVAVARARALELERIAKREAFDRMLHSARVGLEGLEADAIRHSAPSLEAVERALASAREAASIAVDPIFAAETRARAAEVHEALRRFERRTRLFAALNDRIEELHPHEAEANDHADLASRYARAFEGAGWRVGSNDAEFLREVANSGFVEPIVAAIDSWSELQRIAAPSDEATIRALVEAGNAIDPEPWRKEIRAAAADSTPERLLALANSQDVTSRPVTALLSLSGRLTHRGELLAARELLRRAASHHPGEARLRHDLAHLAVDVEPVDVELARVNFEAALALAPESPHMLADVSRFEATHGSTDAALRLARKAIAIDPNSPRAEMVLAGLLLREGDLDAAIDHLERATELGSSAAVPALVELSFRAGRLARALHFAEIDCERRPDSHLAWTQLGRLRIVIEDHRAAIVALERAIELAKDDARSLLLAGFALANLGRDADAIAMLARAEARIIPARDEEFTAVLPAARAIADRVAQVRSAVAAGGDAAASEFVREPTKDDGDVGVALLAFGRPDVAIVAFERSAESHDELGPRRFAAIAALAAADKDPSRRADWLRSARRFLVAEIDVARRRIERDGKAAEPTVRESLEVLALQPRLRALRDEIAIEFGVEESEREAWRAAFRELDAWIASPSRSR